MKINDVIISESLAHGDGFEIEIGDCLIESTIVGFTDDGVIVEADDKALVLMHMHGAKFEQGINEAGVFKKLKRAAKLWDGPDHLKDVINYVRNAPDDVLIRFSKGKGEIPGSHTPRDLQIKLINQELKRRFGLTPRGNMPTIDEAFGPLPRGDMMIKVGGVDVELTRVGKDKNYIGFAWHSSNGKERYEELAVGDLGDYSDLIKKIRSEIAYTERQIAKSADKSMSQVDEAKYQGREVPLGKPMRGDVAKSKVYVRGPKGNVVKVNFGDKTMKIKKSNPKRRKSFRARHRCSTPGPRWKARYWSCRAW